MKESEYRQCKLSRKNSPGSNSQLVSWIPAKYAELGRILRLRRDDDTWEGGWVVKRVGASRTKKDLPDFHKTIRSHRKATGDSLRRIKSEKSG